MKSRSRKLPTRFEPETRFDVEAGPPFRGALESEIDRLKERLLTPLLAETREEGLLALFRRAANEAAAVAWTTPFPLLVLPGLLDERAEAARRQMKHQRKVFRRCRGALGEAA